MAAISINQGTQTVMQTQLVGGTETPVVRLDIGSGTAASQFSGTFLGGTLNAGTITSLLGGTLGNLNAGTITSLGGGTLQRLQDVGTLNAGTVQTIGMRHPNEFATVVTSGTSVLGTIRAAVTGSALYVTGVVVSVQAASNVVIASGGTSTPILGTLFFAGSAGAVAMPFDPPIRTASGSALVYQQSANTGMSITAVGYIS